MRADPHDAERLGRRRVAGPAGVVYALLHVVVAIMLVAVGYPPAPDATAQEIADVVTRDRTVIHAALLVEGLAYGLLFVFLAGVRRWLEDSSGSVIGATVFGAGLVAGAFILVEDAFLAGTAFREGLDPEVAVGLRDAGFAMARVFARFPEAAVMAAVAAATALPKDLRLLAAMAGLGCLSVTPTLFFDDGWYSLHSTVHYFLGTGPFVVVLGALAVHLVREPFPSSTSGAEGFSRQRQKR